jgi:threonine/homoserine/homoserine lactone efflux protein
MPNVLDTLWGLMTYTVVMTITPGPNNILLLSSGLNFGLRRTGWHLAGILSGVWLQICVTGAGLGALFALVPELQILLKLTGSLYMLWLARRLWFTGTLHAASANRSIGYGEALAFQFMNPKTWIMATTVIAVFVPAGTGYSERVVMAGLIFVGVALPCISLWAASGAGLRAWLQEPVALRRINRCLAFLSAVTAFLFWI